MLANVFRDCLDSPNCDMSIVCGKRKFRVHAAILIASSNFFAMILREHPVHIEPEIVVENVEVAFMENILSYLYTGVISIDSIKARNFLEVCCYFQIKGLMTYDVLGNNAEEEIYDDSQVEYHDSELQTTEQTHAPEGVAIEEVYEDTPDTDLIVFLPQQIRQEDGGGTEEDKDEEVPFAEAEIETTEVTEYVTETPKYFIKEDGDIVTEEVRTPQMIRRKRPTVTRRKKRKGSEGYTESQLNDSAEAVCSGQLTLSSASNIYNVPKSMLWRRVKDRPEYSPRPIDKNRSNARKALLKGEPIQLVSKKFAVPIATLYRDKKKLVREGQLDSKMERDKEDCDNALYLAIKAYEGGMAQSEAARKFNVPKATLWRKIKKNEMKTSESC